MYVVKLGNASKLNGDTKIWRYMDFAKFMSLVQESILYFSSLETLQGLDPLEGTIPHLNQRFCDIDPSSVSEDEISSLGIESKRDFIKIQKINQGMIESAGKINSNVFVNSWHRSDIESYLMWKTYSHDKYGIAIQTTIKKLEFELNKVGDVFFIELMQYYNPDNEGVNFNKPFAHLFYKRENFKEESELRAVFYKAVFGSKSCDFHPDGKLDDLVSFYKCPVDLEGLIERIYINPSSDKWVEKLVSAILAKYELRIPVIRSLLLEIKA